MSPYKNSQGHILVCHHDDLTARGLAALLREASSSFTITSATSIGEIVGNLESGLDLIVLGAPSLSLFESASNEAFQRGISVSLPKVVMLSSNINEHLMQEARSQGIDAVIDASMSADEVVNSIFSVIDSSTKATGVSAFQHWKFDAQGTDLQDVCRDEVDVQIISLIIQGHGNEEIALQTFIAVQTVRNRISRLLAAAGAKNRTQLAIMFSRDAETQRNKSRY
jgi:DNA-binding NarL/FixJ family response regulator